MGLRVSHGCFDGSYSGFRALRERVAAAWHPNIGAWYRDTLLAVRAWAQATGVERPAPVWPRAPAELVETDPLAAFLTHSDCEGQIDPTMAAAIARRLREVVTGVVTTPEERAMGWDRQREILQLADGLQRAADASEFVTFS